MKLNFTTLFSALLFTLIFSCKNEPKAPAAPEQTARQPAVNPSDASIKLPDGFTARVFAEELGGRARHIVCNEKGDLYAHMPEMSKGKSHAALRDADGDGKAEIIEYFGDHAGTGMAIANGFLYSSTDREVYRYAFKPGELLPDEDSKVLLVGGFPKQNEHADKTITLDNAGHIYVNVGAPSNACQIENRSAGSKGQDPCPLLEFQAGIWQFDLNKTAQQQAKDGKRYASGIRNAVALDWNPQTNSLFCLQHGRDQLSEFWKAIYTDQQNAELPSEEFFSVSDGDFFGWPYCYFDHLVSKKILGPEYGGDSKKTGRCESAKAPILAFPGHMAPNDLVFYNGNQFPEKYRNGAFIAFHGSWNRAPLEQKGFMVVFVPFKDGKVAGEWEIFAEGFGGGSPIMSPDDARHRPCGLAVAPDGSLYVADSVKGKIWKIGYQQSPN